MFISLRVLLVLLSLHLSVCAATASWSGAGNTPLWSNPSNWGGKTPANGDTVVFPAGALRMTSVNDLPAGISLQSLIFSGAGYAISGNRLITSLVSTSGNTGVTVISLPLQLGGNASIVLNGSDLTLTSVDVSTFILVVSGQHSCTIHHLIGTGSLRMLGAGSCSLDGPNTFSGGLSGSAGLVRLTTATAAGSGPITIGGAGSVSIAGGITLVNNWILLGSSPTIISQGGINSCAGTMLLQSPTTNAALVVTSGSLHISVVINGPGGFTTSGSGDVLCYGFPSGGQTYGTFSGPVTVAGPRLSVHGDAFAGRPAAVHVAAGSQLALIGGYFSGVPLFLGGGGGPYGRGDLVDDVGTFWTGTISIDGYSLIRCAFTDITRNFQISTIIGPGALAKSGLGRLVMSSGNTYVGGTSILEGEVDLSGNTSQNYPSVLRGDFYVAPGATLRCIGYAQIQSMVSASIQGTLDIGDSAESLYGINGSGHLLIGQNGSLAIARGGQFSGAIDDSNQALGFGGTITLTNISALTLSGTNGFTGTIYVPIGTLECDGDSHLASVVINGGTLRGTGEIGDLLATSGTVYPGDASDGGGILTCHSLALTRQATLLADFHPSARHYEQIKVLTDVILGGARLWLGYPPNFGIMPIFIDHQGAGPCSGSLFHYGSYDSPISTTGGDGNDVVIGDVSVEQDRAQADPTSTAPILFDVTFGLPVSDFTASGVVLSGTALPTTAIVSGMYYQYVVSVSGMTQSGTVIVSVPAGAAHAYGFANGPSLSQDHNVTFNYVKPVAAAAQPVQPTSPSLASSAPASQPAGGSTGCGAGNGLAVMVAGLACIMYRRINGNRGRVI